MADASTPQAPLWTRTRQRAHAEITSVAMDLFLADGFEQTTIDRIVAAAGISRRSFFRYFGTKEDVVLRHFLGEGAVLRAELERRPAGEDVWEALRASLLGLLEAEYDVDRLLAISRMVYGTPSLRARSIEKHLRWCADLVPEIERRLAAGAEARSGAVSETKTAARTDVGEDPALRLRAHAIAGCLITCLDVAGEAWTAADGAAPLAHYFDQAVTAVRAPTGP